MQSLPKLMGILNITPDSFSDGGLVGNNHSIIKAAQKLINDGADIIDIGAESTRPGATPLEHKEEWQRLEGILPEICKLASQSGIITSIDTRHAATAKKAITSGIDWVNDVSGGGDKEMPGILASWHGKIVIMHNLGVPPDKNITIPADIDCVAEVIKWLDLRIEALEKQGISKDRIIIDPGIGFGKTAEQSWHIINNITEFKTLGVEVLVGHSRKSFLATAEMSSPRRRGSISQSSCYLRLISKFRKFHISKSNTSAIPITACTGMTMRDAKTLDVSKQLAAGGVDYLRVHNIDLHKQEIKKTY